MHSKRSVRLLHAFSRLNLCLSKTGILKKYLDRVFYLIFLDAMENIFAFHKNVWFFSEATPPIFKKSGNTRILVSFQLTPLSTAFKKSVGGYLTQNFDFFVFSKTASEI